MRFSSRAGDATKFEKIASPARAKNRSCSSGLTNDDDYDDEREVSVFFFHSSSLAQYCKQDRIKLVFNSPGEHWMILRFF